MATPAEQLDILDRFVEYAPKKPYCTNDPASGVRVRGKVSAFKKTHVQHNPPSICHWLTFDQDHENYFIWEDQQLATPNLIVRNLENRRCHISYAIVGVCTSDAAKPKPMYYMESIQLAYAAALRSDSCYNGLITKNPFSDQFHRHELHDHVFSLSELADYVDLAPYTGYRTRKKAANTEVYGYSRHCNLFDMTRFWAYDHVQFYRENYTINYWLKEVLEKAEGYNVFPDPLPYSSIKATAKSVGNWTWKRYFPKGKRVRRGVMSDSFKQSELPLDLKKKQRLAARHTAELKRNATEEKIIDAIGQLTAQGKRVTQAAVSNITGIHRNSLGRNYKHLFHS